jgi:hypothetical protein
MYNNNIFILIKVPQGTMTNIHSTSSSSKYSASFNLKIIALVRVRKRSVLFTCEYVHVPKSEKCRLKLAKTTGTVYGVNLISVISLVNCSRVRDPTTVAGKVFQSLITVGKFEYIVFVN